MVESHLKQVQICPPPVVDGLVPIAYYGHPLEGPVWDGSMGECMQQSVLRVCHILALIQLYMSRHPASAQSTII